MEQRKPSKGEAQQSTGLDAQLAELIETVWECERCWTLDNYLDAAIRYGR